MEVSNQGKRAQKNLKEGFVNSATVVDHDLNQDLNQLSFWIFLLKSTRSVKSLKFEWHPSHQTWDRWWTELTQV
jgi:hypothetical protein